MTYEMSQLDIPDRQLLPTNSHSRASMSTEIGEAQIIHTIFGRAKVRIIRKHDNIRRTLWLTAMVAVAAVVAVAWLEWVASQQTEPLQSADPASSLNASVQESAPATQPESVTMPAAALSATNEPVPPPPIEIHNPAISQKIAPQPAQDLNATGPIPAKPVRPKPLIASKPQAAPLATDDTASMNQPDRPLPPKLSSTKQPVAPAVATPRATLPAAQSSANSPADVAPLAAPLAKEGTSTQSSADGNQAADTANAQP
jgi:hypothetical protein